VNDPLSNLVKFPSCTMKHNTPIEMPDIFLEVCVKNMATNTC
jgi:hypothetical protein